MGQQQLLLIVLGVIVIGIAIVVGINFFHSYSAETKRNNIIDEGINLASMAQQYYMKPVSLGGGGRKFTGWSIPTSLQSTANGSFSAQINTDNVVITAIGNEVVTANVPVEVTVTVNSQNYQVNVVH